MVEQNDIIVFDRDAVKRARARAARNFDKYDFLFEWAQRQVLDRFDDIKRSFPNAVHIGARHTEDFPKSFKQAAGADDLQFISPNDIENLSLEDNSQDLISSVLELHSINDLPGVLHQIRGALKPDGLFIAAMLGGETLYELRDSLMQAELSLKDGMSPRVYPFADKQQAGALLQRAGFALPVVDSDIVTVTYDTMFNLMHDLRGMGENNVIAARNKTNPGKAFFMNAAQHYAQNYSEENGRIKASFEVIFLLGWAPHETQQKPLKPGSAQNRLADALGSDEIKSGEKAKP